MHVGRYDSFVLVLAFRFAPSLMRVGSRVQVCSLMHVGSRVQVCSEEKSCQVRRARAVQELLIRLGHGDHQDQVTGKLSPSSGNNIAPFTADRLANHRCKNP